jgi:fructosamine-3-kinase
VSTQQRRYCAIAQGISARAGLRLEATPERAADGGSINECHRWLSDAGALFVKVAPAAQLAMLEGEAAGLLALTQAQALRVPAVLAVGASGDAAYLALEWIDRGRPEAASEGKLGERLAAQHRVLAERFGWDRDNHIGRTPQGNGWLDDWAEFFRERRLRPQLELAARNGFGKLLEEPGKRLLEIIAKLLGHRPGASLLHGDLWGGNWFPDRHGEPVIFDPAVYHGDREADLAMTRLFGGFGPAFYAAYERALPLPPGAETRSELYNLYHILNHANLFGGGYVQQARAMMDRLLAQARR